ncbi:BON domain-containing protein [Rhizobium leguminosarum]|uniref:BON domain-containing protein n=1 Tax=Rhizobium leguminosarum TaxID=384 RepID=A0A7M3DVF3_RHILE|nr:BON domain-containing protein [Rhizobium leguminosarum]MDV4165490.1 BON domain-containing protein [Rhizobium leguminosarum]MDV4175964.1 BON domain-containing protein [Rhizobium leguminosarum]NKK43550.1 BON domain-containing protein [Rhizobium leguminosarum bv. viciae]NKK85769.1 BON domain-containing protein [Rhizobium leguminosarum bv. viciae]TAY52592.1 BON domain-containing protein [Rhizobium leguminosarum]
MARIGDKTPISREKPELSREEDYRDLEERNLDDGWPYADSSGADPANRPYGETAANFDSDPNKGFRVDGTDEDGNENRLKDSLRADTIDRDESDDLEARVNDNLENIPEVDIDSIEVHADGHVVTLEGSVETIGIARKVELGALSVDGVRHVRNKLQLTGVDAHIPNED